MQPILEMRGISKSFPGVRALDGVDFSCLPGEVHVLIGENGAGKSTLLKILTGMHQMDSGEIVLRGQTRRFRDTMDARRAGIAMVYQELSIIPSLTVAQNIYLNSETKTGMARLGCTREAAMRRAVQKLAAAYQIEIEPYAMAGSLPVAKQQMVEILKALIRDPDIIILDEPTSAIAREEVDKLFEIVQHMKKAGKTIIFISHRMEEVFRFGDRATVLKDGRLVGTVELRGTNETDLVKMMVGREISDVFAPKQPLTRQKTIFSVQHLTYGKLVRDVSFSVYEGEILGIAGLQGHGQPELLSCIAGVLCASGKMELHGKEIKVSSPSEGIAAGIGYIPGDRKKQGLLLDASVRNNLALASLHLRKKALGVIDRGAEARFVRRTIDQLKIKTPTEEQVVVRLSGGNQQKTVLGKSIAVQPRVLLFDEPTRGIDVATKQEFYRMMRTFAKEGVAVIMYSSDLLEIVGLADRVLAMYEGQLVSEIRDEDITEESVMLASVGLSPEEGSA